ncbi:TolC family protein [Eisenibacter elegans]|uniref:TolC family protein n=1 Tax=Eisenibacter elegans TaxID=997 RepID=UPI00047B67D0|nr:TolC family protein [Eisenibacter elegans]
MTHYARLICLLSLGLWPWLAQAQQTTLTLEQAIQQTFANNYSIKVARYQVTVAENAAIAGNAGLMPTVALNAGMSYSLNDVNLVFLSGDGQSIDNAATVSGNASIEARYILYQGGANKRNLQNLLLTARQTDAESRRLVEETLSQTINAYYAVALAQENLSVAQQAIDISTDRFKRAQQRAEFGAASSLDVLNATVDLNADSVRYFAASIDYRNAKRNLNNLMAQSLDYDYEVEKQVADADLPALNTLLGKAKENNAELVAIRQNLRVSENSLHIAQAANYPTIDLNAAYGYNRTEAQAGFVISNQTRGFNAGITLNWPIFNGMQRRTQIQNARIGVDIAQEQEKLIQERIEREVVNAYATYENALFVVRMQERNVRIAEQNFEQSTEKFNFGQINTTQFREAQLNLVQARNALNNAYFTAKTAELEVVRLSGELLQELR